MRCKNDKFWLKSLLTWLSSLKYILRDKGEKESTFTMSLVSESEGLVSEGVFSFSLGSP